MGFRERRGWKEAGWPIRFTENASSAACRPLSSMVVNVTGVSRAEASR